MQAPITLTAQASSFPKAAFLAALEELQETYLGRMRRWGGWGWGLCLYFTFLEMKMRFIYK